MKRFPRIYAESTLKRMYSKLNLEYKQIELLRRYFDAFSNLYGIITMRRAFEIINKQNHGNISEEDFLAFAEIARHENHYYYILSMDELYTDEFPSEPMERELVGEYLLVCGFDDYYNMSKGHLGKEYYVPPKTELLKYADESYYKKTPQTNAILNFFMKDIHMNKSDAEEFLYEAVFELRMNDGQFNFPFEEYERMGLLFTENQIKKFLPLYQELNNNLRTAYNRGHTPNELYNGTSPKAIVFGKNITSALQSGEMDINELRRNLTESDAPDELRVQILSELMKIDNVKPISKNALCPCGSGKKYKRCCGKDK
ncbi:MAG: SEC-C domain-containing protein [Ruminococcus sp.]|nr:SEC-C domain-containing protein [Ruminococcus sp.]